MLPLIAPNIRNDIIMAAFFKMPIFKTAITLSKKQQSAKATGKAFDVNAEIRKAGYKPAGSSFLGKVSKAAGKVVSAPVKFTATVAASPFKVTGKVTGIKAISKLGTSVSNVTKNPFKPVAKVTTGVAKQVKKVPVLGKPLSAVINLGNAPVKLVSQVTSGDNINQSVLNNLKEQVKSVKEIAPYAKMVVSLVPGVGTAVSAAISAGAALATGQSITDALVAGVKGAIPGGFIAQTAFSISTDMISGKSLNTAAINALPLSAGQKSAVTKLLPIAKDLAAGKRVDKTILSNLQKQLPADVQKAINIGIAVGFGKSHQKKVIPAPKPVITVKGKPAPPAVTKLFTVPKVAARQPSEVDKMAIEGKKAIDKGAPVFVAGLTTMKTEGDKKGFYAAVGIMQHTATEAEISKFQKLLSVDQKNGFNIGLAAMVGQKDQPRTGNHLKDFGTFVARGLNGASNQLKVAAVKTVAANPTAKAAILQVAAEKKEGWLRRLLKKMGFYKTPKAVA